ncbi:hypothetical protein [Embleya sp. MST-111070]|uniref:hypothetical protein n=1 Tax=Embleya sp. MST-111070 TaxID=3398231 RepID=UPI003F73287B
MPIYLCRPRSPWQRGTNENTDRLLRQYLPKGVDLRTFSQADLDAIAHELTHRPGRPTAIALRQRSTPSCRTAVMR